jgi:hypothetical protein
MRILVTGGTGFIGSHLVPTLTSKHTLYILSRKNSDRSRLNNVKKNIHFLSYSSLNDLQGIFSKNSFDVRGSGAGKQLEGLVGSLGSAQKGGYHGDVHAAEEERKKLGTSLSEYVDVLLPDWPEKFEEEIKRKALVENLTKGEFKVTKIS